MPEELVDIVDEHDNIIGRASKQEAHTKGLLHRTSVGVIIDLEGKWLLVKQAASRQDPGQFVCPVGGHVSAGETWEEALKREAKEEVGYDNFGYKFIGKVVFNRHVLNRRENHYFAMYEIYSDISPVLNHEAKSFQKFTKDELKNLLKNNPENFGAPFLFLIQSLYPDLA